MVKMKEKITNRVRLVVKIDIDPVKTGMDPRVWDKVSRRSKHLLYR
jgi:hypothetical protein